MFEEESLHTLIARASERRRISLPKVLRASLLAVADEQFSVRTGGNGLAWLQAVGRSPGDTLRGLATVAEAQRDWGWWHKPPWSNLKLLFVEEAVYLRWLDEEIGAAEPPHTEPAVDDGIGTATLAIVAVQPPQAETTIEELLRPARSAKIDEAITAVYDEKERAAADPPNVKKVCPLVREKLRGEGYQASLRQIEELAGHDKHKKRRRPPGKTIASEKRPPLK